MWSQVSVSQVSVSQVSVAQVSVAQVSVSQVSVSQVSVAQVRGSPAARLPMRSHTRADARAPMPAMTTLRT
jgi:hypothetical protein